MTNIGRDHWDTSTLAGAAREHSLAEQVTKLDSRVRALEVHSRDLASKLAALETLLLAGDSEGD